MAVSLLAVPPFELFETEAARLLFPLLVTLFLAADLPVSADLLAEDRELGDVLAAVVPAFAFASLFFEIDELEADLADFAAPDEAARSLAVPVELDLEAVAFVPEDFLTEDGVDDFEAPDEPARLPTVEDPLAVFPTVPTTALAVPIAAPVAAP